MNIITALSVAAKSVERDKQLSYESKEKVIHLLAEQTKEILLKELNEYDKNKKENLDENISK